MAEKKKPTETEEAVTAKTVKMIRSTPQFEGGPTEADVHPDETTSYAIGGWQLAEVPKVK